MSDKGATVDLQAYLRILRKHWRVVPLVLLIVLAATAGVTYLMPKTYESQMQFFVSTVDTSDNNQLAQGSTFLQQRVKSYSQLVESPVVLQPVLNELRLHQTPRALAKHVSAVIPPDTVLINVAVENRSPVQSQQIASAIGRHFPKAVADLETVSEAKGSPVKVTLTKPPTIDPEPVSPRPVINLSLAVIVGLVLGLGIAMLRHMMDTKVRTKEDVESAAPGLAVLGAIPFDGEAPKHPLLVESGPQSPRAEAFRSLRTNLAFVDVANHPRTIVVSSSLPGEGKTTTTANLAVVLAESGATVCLIEGDLRRPRLLDYFGMEGAVGLTDVLIGRAELPDVLQPYGRHSLSLLGAGQIPPNPSELLGSPAMKEVLQELSGMFQYVLIDAPPLLPVTDAAVLSALVGGAVMVVGSGLVTRDQLSTALGSLQAVNGRILGVALNRVPRSPRGGGYYYHYDYRADGGPRRASRETAGAADQPGPSVIETWGWESADEPEAAHSVNSHHTKAGAHSDRL